MRVCACVCVCVWESVCSVCAARMLTGSTASPARHRHRSSRRGAYGDTVEQMDDSIGQILQRLIDTGLAENTCVARAH